MKNRYSTREAAKKLHVALITLQKHVAKGSFPVPPIVKVGGVQVRLWTDHDIKLAKKALSAIRPGRKRKA